VREMAWLDSLPHLHAHSLPAPPRPLGLLALEFLGAARRDAEQHRPVVRPHAHVAGALVALTQVLRHPLDRDELAGAPLPRAGRARSAATLAGCDLRLARRHPRALANLVQRRLRILVVVVV